MAAQPSSRPGSTDAASVEATSAEAAPADEPGPIPPPAPTTEMRQIGTDELGQDWASWFADVVTMPLYRWRTHLVLAVSLIVLVWLGFKAADRLDDGTEPRPTTTVTTATPVGPPSAPADAVSAPELTPVPATPAPTDAPPEQAEP